MATVHTRHTQTHKHTEGRAASLSSDKCRSSEENYYFSYFRFIFLRLIRSSESVDGYCVCVHAFYFLAETQIELFIP